MGKRTGRPRGRPKKPKPDPPRELADEILAADTADKLMSLGARIDAMAARGELSDLKLVQTLQLGLRERRQVLKVKRAEKAEAAVQAIEILTPEEVELLDGHRAKLAGPPLRPGEYVPPPSVVHELEGILRTAAEAAAIKSEKPKAGWRASVGLHLVTEEIASGKIQWRLVDEEREAEAKRTKSQGTKA